MSQKLTPLPFPTILAASLISFIFMVTALAMNAEFRYDLFINGVNTIANIQSANSGFLQVVMNLFSLLGNPVVIIPLIALEYAFSKRRLRALVHICYFIFITFFMALLKQLFQEPRPVWFNPSI